MSGAKITEMNFKETLFLIVATTAKTQNLNPVRPIFHHSPLSGESPIPSQTLLDTPHMLPEIG
jgi:hypothetical protein